MKFCVRGIWAKVVAKFFEAYFNLTTFALGGIRTDIYDNVYKNKVCTVYEVYMFINRQQMHNNFMVYFLL